MPHVQVNGVELYYHEEGSGPTVAFCHGVGGNHLSWWQQVPEFARRFRCVTFDHRGFALSRNHAQEVGAEAFAEDLQGLLDHLGVAEVFLVGQSMGGRTVLNFAKRNPHRVKAMVMAGSVGNIRTPELDRLRREARQTVPKDRLSAALARRVWDERPHVAYLYKLIRMRNGERPPKFLWKDNAPGTTAEEIAAIRTPALFLVGEEDRICPPHVVEAASRLFPNATLLRVPGAGHSVYFEKPQLFNEAVLLFFERHL